MYQILVLHLPQFIFYSLPMKNICLQVSSSVCKNTASIFVITRKLELELETHSLCLYVNHYSIVCSIKKCQVSVDNFWSGECMLYFVRFLNNNKLCSETKINHSLLDKTILSEHFRYRTLKFRSLSTKCYKYEFDQKTFFYLQLFIIKIQVALHIPVAHLK